MAIQNFIQQHYIIGSSCVIGDARRKFEDRVYVNEILRSDQSSLLVGIVADGVGSADNGARGAQLAIDKTVASLQNSVGEDIPAIIKSAVEFANDAVFQDNEGREGDGKTTLVIAVVYKDRCYIGNVGDSRAYWVQQASKDKPGRVTQLTRDHSYYNIYGGDKSSPEANYVVNVIGPKPKLKVDSGFYLIKGEEESVDIDKALKLGITGLPLKPGDSILLCSDGLIKSSPAGEPYVKPSEIVEALNTEYMPDRAAKRLSGIAEGRLPDDNVSAVTIQYLSKELIDDMESRSSRSKFIKTATRVGLGVGALLGLILIAVLTIQLLKKPTSTTQVIVISPTPLPTLLATPTLMEGRAIVMQIISGIASVQLNQKLRPGDEINSNTAGVQIMVGDPGTGGVMNWFPVSTGLIDYDLATLKLKPVLKTGMLYVHPANGSAEVHFSQPDIYAEVSGSDMIVAVDGTVIHVTCFSGQCMLIVGKDSKLVPVKKTLSYDTASQAWIPADGPADISNEDLLSWSTKCNICVPAGVVPEATLTATPTPTFAPPPVDLPTAVPTKKPNRNPGGGSPGGSGGPGVGNG